MGSSKQTLKKQQVSLQRKVEDLQVVIEHLKRGEPETGENSARSVTNRAHPKCLLLVEVVLVNDAAVWRRTSAIECMEDASGTTLAWPEDKVWQVIAVKDIIRPPQRENFNDVYIVYELMDTKLFAQTNR